VWALSEMIFGLGGARCAGAGVDVGVPHTDDASVDASFG